MTVNEKKAEVVKKLQARLDGDGEVIGVQTFNAIHARQCDFCGNITLYSYSTRYTTVHGTAWHMERGFCPDMLGCAARALDKPERAAEEKRLAWERVQLA